MYDENFDRQDGYDIWYKFLKKYKIENINKPLFYYRKHGNSLSTNTKKLLKTRSKIIEKFVKTEERKTNYCIIPVRGKKFNKSCISLKKIKIKPILFWTIYNAIKAKNINKIILSSGDKSLINIVRKKYKSKILYHVRDNEYSYENTSYMNLIPEVIKKKTNKTPDNVIILNIEAPLEKVFILTKQLIITSTIMLTELLLY